jgi:hypothetical protein
MNLDIEKIKAALKLSRDELDGTELNINNYNEEDVEKLFRASTIAWWTIGDTLAALEAFDPDAIRRQCAEAVEELQNTCVTHFPTPYEEGIYDGYTNAIDAIINAGKE